MQLTAPPSYFETGLVYLACELATPGDASAAVATSVELCRYGSRPRIERIAATAHVPLATAAILAGMALLAPAPERRPALLDALLAQADRDHCTELPERCFELVLAWGCGRHPATLPPGPAWPNATLALAGLCEPLVATVLRQLVALQLPPPAGTRLAALHADPLVGAQSYAHTLALDLSSDYGRAALHAWQPARRSLGRHLLEQFGGQPGHAALRSGAFASGLLYPLLQEELGLLDGTVAFSVCASSPCNGAAIARAVEAGQAAQLSELASGGLFEGSRCASCGQPAHPHQTYRLPRRHWLIVPQTRGGAYEQRLFLNCTACGHHFPCSASYIYLHEALEQFRSIHDLSLLSPAQRRTFTHARAALSQLRTETACPLCSRHAVSQRPVQLWVYAPATPLVQQKMVQ